MEGEVGDGNSHTRRGSSPGLQYEPNMVQIESERW